MKDLLDIFSSCPYTILLIRFVNRFYTFKNILTRSIDEQVQANQVVTLLGSLPRRFATLVTATEARVDDVNLDYVQQALIHEDMKQSELSAGPGRRRNSTEQCRELD